MKPVLPPEISQALQAGHKHVRVIDPLTQQVYVLVDDQTHDKAMQALVKLEALNAIQSGIEDMEAGRMQSADDARQQGQKDLMARFNK